MKIWLSKNSEVSVQLQLTTQLILAIVSADLKSGERLPSSNELARRFKIHANTVRASYRDLASRGWIEWRRGSGFYVRERQLDSHLDENLDLDRLISRFFKAARDQGHSLAQIQSRIARWFSIQHPDHVLVLEPDPELRQILTTELSQKTSWRVEGAGLDAASNPSNLVGALCAGLYDDAARLQAVLPAETACVLLRSTSIQKVFAQHARPPKDTLLTVISRWPDFLQWARTTLIAVGLDAAALDLRDARIEGWNRGLTSKSFIITDSVVARLLPSGCKPNMFYVIADESIAEVQERMK